MSRSLEPSVAMLDLWTPEDSFGEPVGCIATTYTFHPELFAEHCLGRFLRIASPPSDVTYQQELIQTLQNGCVYAGVLVDHSQAGQDRPFPLWDVLPVRLPHGGIQHSKVSLLLWSHALRIIVSSANLSDNGYRLNRELSTVFEGSPDGIQYPFVRDVLRFFHNVLEWVPDQHSPPVQRARTFLKETERTVQRWAKVKPTRRSVQKIFIPTLPPSSAHPQGQSALSAVLKALGPDRPSEVRIASPFFDPSPKDLERLVRHILQQTDTTSLRFDLVASERSEGHHRIVQAPSILKNLAEERLCRLYTLPTAQNDEPRPWHAKCMFLRTTSSVAILTGSSNFTCGGMGFNHRYNIEANVLTLFPTNRLQERAERFWPSSQRLDLSQPIEWTGPIEETEDGTSCLPPLPAGFLSATYARPESGQPTLILRLDPEKLPPRWSIHPSDNHELRILDSDEWAGQQRLATVIRPYTGPSPSSLLVRWDHHAARWPVNLNNPLEFPAPDLSEGLDHDEWLALSVSRNKSAFLRRRQKPGHRSVEGCEDIILDPLKRYALSDTFLHKVRRRARSLERWKASLESPAFRMSAASLRGRFEGAYGAHTFLQRLRSDLLESPTKETPDERLLHLTEAFLVLKNIRYRYEPGALPPEGFRKVFRRFLRKEVELARQTIQAAPGPFSPDILGFCEEVLERCLKA